MFLLLPLSFFDFAGNPVKLLPFCLVCKYRATDEHFFLFEDRLVMGKVCVFHDSFGCWPSLWKTIPKNYLTNCMWLCGMIFLQCSHLTGLRLGGMLHITIIHALFCVGSSVSLLFPATYTSRTPPSKYAREESSSVGQHACNTIFFLRCKSTSCPW